MENRFKFRSWDRDKMEYSDKTRLEVFFASHEDLGYDKPPDIIMQCTGLKDKNDKLIYEGDIVKLEKEESSAIVKFRSGSYFAEFINKDEDYLIGAYHSTRIEIIDNIYENELLTTKV